MALQNDIAVDRHRSMQMLVALFSVIFVAVVAYGYYHLLRDFGWFVALLGALVISALAWLLARVAGTGDRPNWILIAPLFIISAAGVFNTMMVYLEGGQVMSDAAASSQRSFARVENAASTQLETMGIARRINKVNSLRDALFSEIRNPLNCGQGPEARRLISELQRELPEFKPLSGGGKSCANVDSIVEDYTSKLSALTSKAAWNDSELSTILEAAKKGRIELADLQLELTRSYSPGDLHQIRGILEGKQTEYQDLLFRLGKRVNTADFPSELDIRGAQSLGNVYKLPALFFSRITEASTYVYLLIALGFDLLLVYLFGLARKSRVKTHAIDGAITGAW